MKENLSDPGSQQSEKVSTKGNTISKKEYEKLDAEKIFGNKKKDHIDKFAAGEITFDEFDEIETKKRNKNKGGKRVKPRNDPANQGDVMKMFNFNKKP